MIPFSTSFCANCLAPPRLELGLEIDRDILDTMTKKIEV